MIDVTVLLEQGAAVGFDLKGHAGYAEDGEDIVCSAVSALAQTAIMGITEVAKISAGVSVDYGDIHCVVAEDATQRQLEDAALIIDTMLCGLRDIEKAYPKTLKITDREV